MQRKKNESAHFRRTKIGKNGIVLRKEVRVEKLQSISEN